MSSDRSFERSVDARLDRRGFLGLGGVLSGVLVAGGSLALVAPSRTWAVEIRSMTSAEAAMLLAMARTIAPHDGLEDAAYAVVVKAVDGMMAGDPGTATLVREGLASLGADFVETHGFMDYKLSNMLKSLACISAEKAARGYGVLTPKELQIHRYTYVSTMI